MPDALAEPSTEPPAESPAEPCTCAALRRAARAATAVYDAALRPVDLRVTQFAVLRLLDRRGPLAVSRLALEAALERSTMGRNLDPLERRGLVTLAACPADGRARIAALTEAGRATLVRAEPHWRAAQGAIAARVAPGAATALADALAAVLASVLADAPVVPPFP